MASSNELNETLNWEEYQITNEAVVEMLRKPLSKGEKWFVLCKAWFLSFKTYIGLTEETDEIPVESTFKIHPGQIDNSKLFEEGDDEDIEGHLQDQVDFVLVPIELWNLLWICFGLPTGQKPIAREVVQHGFFVPNLRVEIFPRIPLTIKMSFDKTHDFEVLKFSKYITIETLDDQLRSMNKVSKNTETRFWLVVSKNSFEPMRNKLTDTLEEAGLCPEQVIVWDVMSMQIGRWTNEFEPFKLPQAGSGKRERVEYYGRRVEQESRNAGSILRSIQQLTTQKEAMVPGVCGMLNIGNTCFMNSVIQLISNCPPITEYFLNSDYQAEVNENNPLGMRGEIAKAFANVVKCLWSGDFSYVSPAEFKSKVSLFAPQFSGYYQHDAQELLTFLLDGLHEDLNRIKIKPLIQIRDYSGLPDEIVARKTWENYLLRNDSVIVDNFHGMLKSTVVCPECEQLSVTFDPFCTLSLQLPSKRQCFLEVIYVDNSPSSKPVRYRVVVPKRGLVKDLVNSISLNCNVPSAQLLVADVSKCFISRVLTLNHLLDDVAENDQIYVYELPLIACDTEKYMVVPVCHREMTSKTLSPAQLFGHPMVVVVPRKECTYQIIYNIILRRLSRYVRILNDNSAFCNGHGGSLTPEDDKVIEETGNKNPAPELRSDNESVENGADLKDQVSEDVVEDAKTEHLFTIHFVSSASSEAPDALQDDGSFIDFPSVMAQCNCSLHWTTEAKTKFFSSKALKDVSFCDTTKSNQKENSVRLTDCLEMYIAREKLGTDDAWYCPGCEKHQQASKKFDLWSLPRILVIHLKRFSFSRARRDKLETAVSYPLRGLDMSKYVLPTDKPVSKYNLVGVCNHDGILSAGHYTSIAMNKNTKKWYQFDDICVRPISEDTVVSANAYVLLYIRDDIMDEHMDTN